MMPRTAKPDAMSRYVPGSGAVETFPRRVCMSDKTPAGRGGFNVYSTRIIHEQTTVHCADREGGHAPVMWLMMFMLGPAVGLFLLSLQRERVADTTLRCRTRCLEATKIRNTGAYDGLKQRSTERQ